MKTRHQRGFTLLEVLVATTIMSVAVVGLMSALQTSLGNASKLTSYDRATLLAKHKMDELQADQHLVRNSPLQGMWPPELTNRTPTGWNAFVKVAEAPPSATGPQTPVLEEIDLQVWWMDSPQERKTLNLQGFRRSLLVPQPTLQAPAAQR